jgi:hypothetical protein
MSSNTHQNHNTQCIYPGCTRDVWRDPNGSYSSFCGNTHRFAMASNPRSQTRTCKVWRTYQTLEAFGIILTLSKNCNVKPVYIENGKGMFYPYSAVPHGGTHFFLAHDFCGRRCAGEFNNNGPRPSQPSSNIMCIIPGCRNRAYVDADGKATKFCSHRHRLYVSGGGCPKTTSDAECNEQCGCSTWTSGCLLFVCGLATPV